MSALEKSTRRKIFYGMVLLFAVVAPVALLYSRGYVFDRERRGRLTEWSRWWWLQKRPGYCRSRKEWWCQKQKE